MRFHIRLVLVGVFFVRLARTSLPPLSSQLHILRYVATMLGACSRMHPSQLVCIALQCCSTIDSFISLHELHFLDNNL